MGFTLERVERSDLFDVSQTNAEDIEDLELQKTLDELIESTLHAETPVPARKRRKLNPPSVEAEDAPETSVLFRLLSTTHTISLLPRPPPPPVTREPECEDTEWAAETRRQQAAAVACDAAWVMRESARLPPPFRVGRVEHVRVTLLGSPPPILLAHRLQSPRKTRPPVPRSELQHYPYASAPILVSPAASECVPSVDIIATHDGPRKTRRRRRRKNEEKTRPQARFWRPPEGCGGKSAGYAMGY
ncbi:hypothetical protein C8R45DRAFT_963543 [Mycena sanguinolenta]|nr:hypothetical protein C8R45DRAFT_963543 [Mycena sanguinolenta]